MEECIHILFKLYISSKWQVWAFCINLWANLLPLTPPLLSYMLKILPLKMKKRIAVPEP